MITKGMERFLKENIEVLFHPMTTPSLAVLVESLEREAYEKDLSEFQAEYERLFYRPPKGEFVAPPYSSYYAAKGFVIRPSKRLNACWEDLMGHGLDPKTVIRGTISEELGFMSLLCKAEAKAKAQEGDAGDVQRCIAGEQARFLSRHLLPWIEVFCRRLETGSRLAFYRLLAHVTYNFVSSDQQRLLGVVGK